MAKKAKSENVAPKPRPFITRNLKRLDKIANMFGALMKDLDRVKVSAVWVETARINAEKLAESFDGLQHAIETAPSDFAVKRVVRRKNGISVGSVVTLSPLYAAKYSSDVVGIVGAEGKVLDLQAGGALVQFVEGTLPAFVRIKHLSV